MARFQPAFSDYSVQALQSLSDRELRKEYTRMRDVAQKRVKRLREAMPESKASKQMVTIKDAKGKTVKEYVGFRELKDIDPRDLRKALSEMAKFVSAKTSTVSGQRERQRKTIETLNKAIGAGKGQAGVTIKNYWRVIKILEETRRRKITYGSDKIVTLAESTMELNKRQFNDILDNLEKSLENADEFKGSLDDYMKKKDIKNSQKVDMDSFIKELGW